MNQEVLIYPLKFRATDGYSDPRNIAFRALGLVKKDDYIDTNGDIYKKEWYLSYDEQAKEFNDLALQVDRTYTRNPLTGILEKRDEVSKYYDENGKIQLEVQLPVKIYTTVKGITGNQMARNNLIEKAKKAFFMTIYVNSGGDIATTNAHKDDFLSLSSEQRGNYLDSSIDPLLNLLDDTLDNQKPEYRAYMTSDLVATLKTILNISYTS